MNRDKANLFVQEWSKRKKKENSEKQQFWDQFFLEVLELDNPFSFAEYEKPVPTLGKSEKTGRRKRTNKGIDAYIPSAKTIIEHKSFGVSLDKEYKQSDGEPLTAFGQAIRYNNGLTDGERARFIITCNFVEFRIYDLNDQDGLFGLSYVSVPLEELPRHLEAFSFLIPDETPDEIVMQRNVDVDAAALMGKLHRQLLSEYETMGYPLDELPVLMVRLLFCLYAEDSGLFAANQFHDYLADREPGQRAGEFRDALRRLFAVLDTPEEERGELVSLDLAAFPYCNGGLFARRIEVPFFDGESKETLLKECSREFAWDVVSPVVFGATFEEVLSGEDRRHTGQHYTAPENIRRVIDPLFMDDLRGEVVRAETTSISCAPCKTRWPP